MLPQLYGVLRSYSLLWAYSGYRVSSKYGYPKTGTHAKQDVSQGQDLLHACAMVAMGWWCIHAERPDEPFDYGPFLQLHSPHTMPCNARHYSSAFKRKVCTPLEEKDQMRETSGPGDGFWVRGRMTYRGI